ncbi:MAG: phosphotransferase [Methanosarcinaceae archaeon]|uniref:phosphotransferase n=1 Tax=Methanosarcina sp. MTP4 TaxID=1434100 RepID=UPI00064F891F|nr:phosphotransferase [Methanosarcina sp. MTP4]
MVECHVNTLKPGDPFRDWLVEEVVGQRVRDKRCCVKVFKNGRSSHTVCRYHFKGEHFSVMAKYFAEPTDRLKKYDACKAMKNEFKKLELAASYINVAKPLAVNEDFNCALVTEHVPGKSLGWYFKHDTNLYEILTRMSHMLRRLHDNTLSSYNKENEFKNYHDVLDHLGLDYKTRETFNHFLGEWWYSDLLDRKQGCMIHRDVHPSNYIFYKGKPYALDFESSWFHANPVRDLGILSAELKNYFEQNKGGGWKAEPYIGHLLWEYSRNEKDFSRITKTLPFYMSVGLLRSARLHQENYRDYLIREAMACLEPNR